MLRLFHISFMYTMFIPCNRKHLGIFNLPHTTNPPFFWDLRYHSKCNSMFSYSTQNTIHLSKPTRPRIFVICVIIKVIDKTFWRAFATFSDAFCFCHPSFCVDPCPPHLTLPLKSFTGFWFFWKIFFGRLPIFVAVDVRKQILDLDFSFIFEID